MNLQLQGSVVTLIKCKTVICSFLGKLTLFKLNIGRREFYQFPRLAELAVLDDDFLAYCDHLDAFKMDMTKRFTDLLELEIPDCALSLQEELIDLQSDCDEKARFKIWVMNNFGQHSPNVAIMLHYGREPNC